MAVGRAVSARKPSQKARKRLAKSGSSSGSGSGSGDARRPAPSAVHASGTVRVLAASRAPDARVVRQGVSYEPHICLPAERCPHEWRRARLIDEVQVRSVRSERAQRLQLARPPAVMPSPSRMPSRGEPCDGDWPQQLAHVPAPWGGAGTPWGRTEGPSAIGTRDRPLTGKPAGRGRSGRCRRCGSPQHARQATHLPANARLPSPACAHSDRTCRGRRRRAQARRSPADGQPEACNVQQTPCNYASYDDDRRQTICSMQ